MSVTVGSRPKLQRLLANLPALLAGKGGGQASARIAEAMLRAGGLEALSIIRKAFVVKARGGTDAAGVKWKPLDPKTIAYGRRHPGLDARRRTAASKRRPLLTKKLDALWRSTYAKALRGRTTPEARGIAAGHAWKVVKAAGGKTILSEYGSRPVEIGRDTGRLLASLSPGSPDTLLDVAAQTVAVGTNVEYAGAFHARRPLWPEVWPDVWLDRVADAMARAGSAALAKELANGP